MIKDDDPDGLKLLAAPDPLERAAKLLSPLQQLRPELLDTWLASYDVAIRRSKCWLLISTFLSLLNAKITNPNRTVPAGLKGSKLCKIRE